MSAPGSLYKRANIIVEEAAPKEKLSPSGKRSICSRERDCMGPLENEENLKEAQEEHLEATKF